MYSKTIIVGNLGADPETRVSTKGTNITKLRVAVKGERKEDETEWWSVTAFGQSADYAAKYLSKGQQVLVEGRIKINKWIDKKTDQERMGLEITAHRVSGGPRPAGQGSSFQPNHDEKVVRMPYSGDEEVPF